PPRRRARAGAAQRLRPREPAARRRRVARGPPRGPVRARDAEAARRGGMRGVPQDDRPRGPELRGLRRPRRPPQRLRRRFAGGSDGGGAHRRRLGARRRRRGSLARPRGVEHRRILLHATGDGLHVGPHLEAPGPGDGGADRERDPEPQGDRVEHRFFGTVPLPRRSCPGDVRMNFIQRKPLPRRVFLKGAGGVVLALPFLEASITKAQISVAPMRFVVWFTPGGLGPTSYPTRMNVSGTAYEPLQPFADRLIVTRGFAMKSIAGQSAPPHPTGFGHLLTG